MERRTTKEIVESIRRGTRFTYREDRKYKKASFIAPLNIDRVEYAVFQGEVEPEDYYLMELVYDACFITPEFLYYRIKIGADHGEKGCKMIEAAGLLSGLSPLFKRLEKLAVLGFFFCYEPEDIHSAKRTRIYYCSMEGFRAFTHRLERRLSYNRSLVYRPMHDIFRFLATNVAIYAMCKNPNFKKKWSYDMFELRQEGGRKVSQEEVYGRVLFQDPASGRKVYVVIEPVFFRCDTNYITTEDNMKHIVERIEKVKQIVMSFDGNDNTEAYALFLMEDDVGVKKLQDYIATQEIAFFSERCFYTSENALFESSVKGGDGTDSLLGLAVKNGGIAFKQKDLPGTV